MKHNFSPINPDGLTAKHNRPLNLDALRSFVAICETGTFRRAAARVNRSPSAISLQMSTLEEQLDTRLMTRDARHVALTEQGEKLLGYARQLLGISAEAMAVFHAAPLAGHLRLAAPHDLGVSQVPGLLQKLADAHPGIVVDVCLGTSDAVQQMFTTGAVHVALFNEVRDTALAVHRLASEPLVWTMCAAGRAVTRTPLPLAIAEIGCAWRAAALQALDDRAIPYRISYSSDTSMGQIAALNADLAIAVLPGSLAVGKLAQVPRDLGLPYLPDTHIYLAHDGSDLARAVHALAVQDMRIRRS